MKKPVLIGITGGTGSGKSTIAKEIFNQFNEECIAIIQQDSYYKDQSDLSMEERVKTNYDHPTAFDNDLLVSHLQQLLKGNTINKPIYDFAIHNRVKDTIMHLQFTEPTKRHADLIIPEGGQNKVAIDIMVAKIKQILQ